MAIIKSLLYEFRDICKSDHIYGSGAVTGLCVIVDADDKTAKRQPPCRYHPKVLESQAQWIREDLFLNR